MTSSKPTKCIITKLGLAALLLGALCIAGIFAWQKLETGSFARGDGFVAPHLGMIMLGSAGVGLVLAMIGSVVDSIHYGRWKKQSR